MASQEVMAGLSQLLSLRTSPELIAAREMLQLPSMGLEAAVESELTDNPALERVEPGECPLCGSSWDAVCALCRSGRNAGRASGMGPDGDPMQGTPYRETDAETLLRHVRLVIPNSDFSIAEYLIGSLDVHGFLDQEPDEVASALGVSMARVTQVLCAIRQEGPPGIGASGVRECLLLQLDQLPVEEDVRSLARSVIEEHLPALAKGRFTAICRVLGVSRAALGDAQELIRSRLRPYPAFEGRPWPGPLSYRCVPDVVVTEPGKRPGGFDVELIEPRRFRLRINPLYLDAARQLPAAEQSHVRTSVAEARSFLTRLEDRWSTLRQVSELAAERQGDFLRRGPLWLHPLTRVEVARELRMHESTVSRAVTGKYVMLPCRKVIALADFFSSGGGLAEEIRAIVAAEAHALSDEQLAACLRARGYEVARRTVTKYRQQAGIPAAALR